MLHATPSHHTINLGLQGGGAHGAFTWGVLDALLEDGRLDFEGLSGTSAGALNAAVLAHGLSCGGRDGAREALARFWNSIALSTPSPFGALRNAMPETNNPFGPSLQLMQQMTQHFSPYALNPFDLNPLRDRLDAQIDFERLRTQSKLKLFVATTHANSGRLRLFTTCELTLDALLASTCLPSIQQAVVIDGEPYWDGGYAANPAVSPLFCHCKAQDILLVLLNPLHYDRTPRSAEEIRGREADIAFQAAFLQEMRVIAQALRYAEGDVLPLGRLERRLHAAHFHLIEADTDRGNQGSASRMLPHADLLLQLRNDGRDHTRQWLKAHFAALGERSSMDVRAIFG